MTNASVSVSDLDKSSGDFVDFLDDIKRLAAEHRNGNDTDEETHLVASNMLTPTLQAGLGFRDAAELSLVYENLIRTWIVPLSHRIPGRVRIAIEKLLRDVVGQVCLASYAVHINMETEGKEEKGHSESLKAGGQFVLPVRRRASVTSLGKGKERSDAVSSSPPPASQMSEDAGSMPSSAFAALPTPEPTPSLRSRSSESSLVSLEDAASQRLRAYASLTPQPALPAKLTNLLGHWQVGMDPAKYDWEAAQQATVIEDESEDEPKRKRTKGARKRQKRQRMDTVAPSSLPTPKLARGSQLREDQDVQAVQSSSQQTDGVITMSQIEPGKFGGRHAKNKKAKRPAGFK